MAEEEPVSENDSKQSDSKKPNIVRHKVGSISIFEIKEDELDALARGSRNSVLLNFGIFLLSVGISFLVTLLTVQISTVHLLVVFLVVTAVSLIVGAVLLLLWRLDKNDVSHIVKTIRSRDQVTTPNGTPDEISESG